MSRDRVIPIALRATVAVNALGVSISSPLALGRTATYGLDGDVPVSMALNASPDLVFAAIFLWWARS